MFVDVTVTIIIEEKVMNLKRSENQQAMISKGKRMSGNNINIVFTYKIIKKKTNIPVLSKLNNWQSRPGLTGCVY